MTLPHFSGMGQHSRALDRIVSAEASGAGNLFQLLQDLPALKDTVQEVVTSAIEQGTRVKML